MRTLVSVGIGLALLAAPAFSSAQADRYAVPARAPEYVQDSEYLLAVVEAVLSDVRNTVGGFDHRTQTVRMRVEGGPHSGDTFTVDNGVLDNRNDMTLRPGDRMVVERMTIYDGSVRHLLRERYRLPAIGWLLAAFLALSVLFGGVRGFTSMLGLAASVGILGFFVVPGIAGGADPLLVSLGGSYAIAVCSMYLAHGWNRRTSVALLFGMGTEESMFLQTGGFAAVNLQGLLVGGFIIGALGVLDDVTTAQTATVDEISKANPDLSAADLRKAGMSVGREHIASLINTLALAYVGASLPLFLLFHENNAMPAWIVANGEFIAEEIVRTLVGSTALLLAVPISTWLAAALLRNRTGRVVTSTHPPHPCAHHRHA